MSIYEVCHYCGDWWPGEDLVQDGQGHHCCLPCQSGKCMSCRRNEPVRRSNLCVSCAMGLGVAALLDCVGHGVRLCLDDEYLERSVIGIAEALFVMQSHPVLLFSIPWTGDEDEPVRVGPIPASVIERIEVCVRLERDADDEITPDSYVALDQWMLMEYGFAAIAAHDDVVELQAKAPERPARATQELLDALGASEEDDDY
jgi:hypothetical protein